MNEEQVQALIDWVEAAIAEKIETALWRDCLHESVIEDRCREHLYVALGLREKKS